MNSNDLSKAILKTLLVIFGVAILLWFLYSIKLLLIHIIIASIISVIGHPIIVFLERRFRFRRTPAVLSTMAIFIGLLIGFVYLCIPLIESQGKNLALLDTDTIKTDLITLYDQIQAYLKSKNISLFDSLGDTFIKYINITIPILLNSVAKILGNLGVTIFNVSFISFFFMKDDRLFERMLLTPFPSKSQDSIRKSMQKIKKLLSNYFIGLCFQIFILFIIYAITLTLFGVENALFSALLCALLNLIPFIGPIIGAILIGLITMTNFLGSDLHHVIIPKTIYVLCGFIFGQFIDNIFSQPFIFSKSVKSHPLEIFLVIIIGGLLYGAVGMIVAIPLYTSIKVVTKEFLSDNKIVKSLTKNI